MPICAIGAAEERGRKWEAKISGEKNGIGAEECEAGKRRHNVGRRRIWPTPAAAAAQPNGNEVNLKRRRNRRKRKEADKRHEKSIGKKRIRREYGQNCQIERGKGDKGKPFGEKPQKQRVTP
jgi:hypothetical protein